MTVTTFSELELDESLLEALQDKGFTRPTAIQAAAIPPALDGRDVLGSAPTGTGKTAAYLLPALQHLLDFPRKKSGPPRILILTPTRELAMQVADHARELAKHTHLDIATITGGVAYMNHAVTIRDLTGSVTKINTRATTISDWDRKEIIVPNKAFITEQFINWSLSDSVTRVVLTIPAPADANSEEVTEILLTAARRCSLVIDNPAPEVFLVDLQQGIQIFELRIYAAEMGHRMPLRHEIHQLILAGFHAHGIDMPFPPFQMRLESLNGKQTGRTLTSAGKGRQAGSL